MKTKHYDVFVIGSGIAGQTAAEAAAKDGKKVAIADNRKYGGTCSQRGCDPKKIMFQFADLLQKATQLQKKGIKYLPEIQWKAVQKYKSNYTNSIPTATEKDLKELGIDLYHQSPKFVSTNTVEVEGKTISADKFVIATGLIPRKLDIKGAKHLKISDDVLNLKKIPKSAIILGSGYVGMEFCYMLSTLGCKVTMIETGERILSPFDDSLATKLQTVLEKRGVTFIFNAETTQLKKLNKNYKVSYNTSGKEKTIKARIVYNTTGRVPAISKLQLDKANIDFDESGILVNDHLQSKSNKDVYACGDVSSMSLPLTPLSGLQGHIVGKNLIKQNSETFKSPLVPSVVFTHPQLAAVGYTEDEAKSRYKNVDVYKADASEWFNAKKANEKGYAFKVLVNARTEQIVGAHILSPTAAETINLLTMAMNTNMKISEFKKQIFTYPTYSADLKSMLSETHKV